MERIKRSRSRAANLSSPPGLPQPMGVELLLPQGRCSHRVCEAQELTLVPGGEVRDARNSPDQPHPLPSTSAQQIREEAPCGPWCSSCRRLPRAAPLPLPGLAGQEEPSSLLRTWNASRAHSCSCLLEPLCSVCCVVPPSLGGGGEQEMKCCHAPNPSPLPPKPSNC